MCSTMKRWRQNMKRETPLYNCLPLQTLPWHVHDRRRPYFCQIKVFELKQHPNHMMIVRTQSAHLRHASKLSAAFFFTLHKSLKFCTNNSQQSKHRHRWLYCCARKVLLCLESPFDCEYFLLTVWGRGKMGGRKKTPVGYHRCAHTPAFAEHQERKRQRELLNRHS